MFQVALMRRFYEAKLSGLDKVEVWGTGTPRREFIHVDDLASGCIHLLEHYSEQQPGKCWNRGGYFNC